MRDPLHCQSNPPLGAPWLTPRVAARLRDLERRLIKERARLYGRGQELFVCRDAWHPALEIVELESGQRVGEEYGAILRPGLGATSPEHEWDHRGRHYLHYWLRLEDGTIVDPAASQFGERTPLVIPPRHPLQRRYLAFDPERMGERAPEGWGGRYDEPWDFTHWRRNPDEGLRRLERAWANEGSVEAARAYLGALKRSSRTAARMADRIDSLWDTDWEKPPLGLVDLIWLVSTGRMETENYTGYDSIVGIVIEESDLYFVFTANIGVHAAPRWKEFQGTQLVHLGVRSVSAPGILPYMPWRFGVPWREAQGRISGGGYASFAVPQQIAVLWSRAHGAGEGEGEAKQNPYHGTQKGRLRSIRERGLIYPFISSREGQAWCWADGYADPQENGRVLEVEIPDPYLLVPDWNFVEPVDRERLLGVDPEEHFDVRSILYDEDMQDRMLDACADGFPRIAYDQDCDGWASVYLGTIPWEYIQVVRRPR